MEILTQLLQWPHYRQHSSDTKPGTVCSTTCICWVLLICKQMFFLHHFLCFTSRDIIRNAVNASEHDAVIFTGSGCTAAVHKLLHALHLNQTGTPPPVSMSHHQCTIAIVTCGDGRSQYLIKPGPWWSIFALKCMNSVRPSNFKMPLVVYCCDRYYAHWTMKAPRKV